MKSFLSNSAIYNFNDEKKIACLYIIRNLTLHVLRPDVFCKIVLFEGNCHFTAVNVFASNKHFFSSGEASAILIFVTGIKLNITLPSYKKRKMYSPIVDFLY